MTTNTELIAGLQSNIVGDPFPLMRKAADAIETLESEVGRLKGLAVMEFNEDEVPSFTQGYHPHELTTAVTADRCSVLVKMITDLRAQLAAAQGQSWSDDQMIRFAWLILNHQNDVDSIEHRLNVFRERDLSAPIPQQVAEPSVPVGWKLVPVVPTSEMIEAAVDRFFAEDRPQHRVNAHHIYAAMFAASPQPKEPK